MTIYGGDVFAYDFEAARAAIRERRSERLTASDRYGRTHFPNAPTEAQLRKHAGRFGKDGVSEIASAYDLTAAAAELEVVRGGRQRETSECPREQGLFARPSPTCSISVIAAWHS